MRILLDECVNMRWRREIPAHDVRTVDFMGWKSLKNGELLTAAAAEFDIFVTLDGNIPTQQPLERFDIAVFVLKAPSNALPHLRPLLPALLAAAENPIKGKATLIETEQAFTVSQTNCISTLCGFLAQVRVLHPLPFWR